MKKETVFDAVFDYPELDKMSAEVFYSTYKDFMHSIARQEGLDKGQADMAVDDVLIVIYVKHACHFDPQKSRFSNYLAAMVRNACRSLKRREHRYVSVDDEELLRLCEENGAVSGKQDFEPGEIMGCIGEGIRILRTQVRSQRMVDAYSMQLLEEEGPKYVGKKLNERADYVSLAKNHCNPRMRCILKELMAQ